MILSSSENTAGHKYSRADELSYRRLTNKGHLYINTRNFTQKLVDMSLSRPLIRIYNSKKCQVVTTEWSRISDPMVRRAAGLEQHGESNVTSN